jgi:enoyl-CoA hydratase/carnithine racemase
MTTTQSVIGELRLERDGTVATLLIDRPAKLNALTLAMVDALDRACAALEVDEGVRVVVVRSTSARAFCAGADVAEWSSLSPEAMWRRWIAEGHRVFDRLAALPMPTIAMIDGMAFGGGLELALACDLRIASSRARLALPEVRIGIVAGWGGTARLAALVGAARAKQLALTGEPIDGGTASAWGLVNEVVPAVAADAPERTAPPDPDLVARVSALAATIAERPSTAVQVTKQLVGAAAAGAPSAILDALAAGFVTGTDDLREGVAAFREKRAPRFRK